MGHQSVAETFSRLLADLETALKSMRQSAAEATQQGSYAEARTLMDMARQVERFIAVTRTRRRQWERLHSKSRSRRAPIRQPSSRGERTPLKDFWLPILQALVALGGQAQVSEVWSMSTLRCGWT
ncbi:MAG: hypothetical protein NZ473_04850 [Candidatus Kapabacteria bacterium]|nr:hypothetical protein [Candidatus Kapabacteria bacterium]MDW8224540.1 hypothetical protein [Bacteroidota bacterium]